MKRIDDRTVEYTTMLEVDVVAKFDELLDAGYGIPDGAMGALEWAVNNRNAQRRDLTREFVDHLSEGTVIVCANRDVVYTGKGRALMQQAERLVHLHTPASANPVCGAPIPEDRRAGLTAYRSNITCPACLATLRPVSS